MYFQRNVILLIHICDLGGFVYKIKLKLCIKQLFQIISRKFDITRSFHPFINSTAKLCLNTDSNWQCSWFLRTVLLYHSHMKKSKNPKDKTRLKKIFRIPPETENLGNAIDLILMCFCGNLYGKFKQFLHLYSPLLRYHSPVGTSEFRLLLR